MTWRLIDIDIHGNEFWVGKSADKKIKINIEEETYSISWDGLIDDELVLEAKRFINICK